MWSGRPINRKAHQKCLAFARMQDLELPCFSFYSSFYTLEDFNEWWSAYYSQVSQNDQFLENLVDTFAAMASVLPPPQLAAPTDVAPKKVCVFLRSTLLVSLYPILTMRSYRVGKELLGPLRPELLKDPNLLLQR